jgi:RimJ/RimL family protein N-acetyltransferase
MGHDVPPAPRVREAALADEDLLLSWRNDAGTRNSSRSTDEVDPEEHRRWLGSVLRDPGRLLLIGADPRGNPVGTVRFDSLSEGLFEVSLTVAPDRRGEGWASPLLLAAEATLRSHEPDCRIRAFIRESNAASLAAFARAGYESAGEPATDGGTWLVK